MYFAALDIIENLLRLVFHLSLKARTMYSRKPLITWFEHMSDSQENILPTKDTVLHKLYFYNSTLPRRTGCLTFIFRRIYSKVMTIRG